MSVATAPLRLAPSPPARLLCNGVEVPRPYVARATGGPVDVIAPNPLASTLPHLLEALHSGQSFCISPRPFEADDEPEYIHTLTSGSTGAPKRIRRSYASWVSSFAVNSDLFGITPDDRSAILGSLDQSLALYALCEGLWQGVTVDVLSDLRPDRQTAAMEQTTILYATPTQLRSALLRPLPALRLILVGGGHLDAATKARVAQMAPNARLHEFYGAAETSFITLSDATTPEGSVGAPYPGVEIDIRDGLVWVRSPYLFDHYAEGSSATTQTRKGWVTVGEMGEMRDGHLFLTGRADRMFTVADRNYHPEAAEAALSQIDGVHGIAVLPMLDDMRGAVPVVLYHGMITPEDLQTAARTAGIQIRRAYRLSDWPALPSGKPNLTALAALLRNLT